MHPAHNEPFTHGNEALIAVQESAQGSRRNHLLNPNKPLPNLPVAQFVDTTNPSEAHRTLIDAEVVGTPSSEDWPALVPEDILVSDNDASGDQTPNFTNPIVLGCSLTSILCQEVCKVEIDTSDPIVTTSTAPDEVSVNTTGCFPTPGGPSHALIDVNASESMTVNALESADSDAVDAPLTGQIGMSRRVNVKRASLVSLRDSANLQKLYTVSTAENDHQDGMSSDIKWPVLEATGFNVWNTSIIPPKHVEQNRNNGCDDNLKVHLGASNRNNAYETALLHHTSMDLNPIRGQIEDSFVDHELDTKGTGFRTRRISGPSSAAVGPVTLRIAHDADAFLLGKSALFTSESYAKGAEEKRCLRRRTTTSSVPPLSAGLPWTPTLQVANAKADHNSDLQEPRSGSLSKHDEIRQDAASAYFIPATTHKTTTKKRFSRTSSTPAVDALARMSHTPSNDSIFKTSSTLSNPSHSTVRAEVLFGSSRSRARPTVNSNPNGSMMNQKASLQGSARIPKVPVRSAIGHSADKVIKHDGRSHRQDDEVMGETAKASRIFKKGIFHKNTALDVSPDMPSSSVAAKHSSKRSSLIGSTLGARFTRGNPELAKESGHGSIASRKKGILPVAPRDKHRQKANDRPAPNDPHKRSSNARVMSLLKSSSNSPIIVPLDTRVIVEKVKNHVSQLPENASDRLCGLEIAEVRDTLHKCSPIQGWNFLTKLNLQAILNAVEACNQARVAAVEAQANARQAALSVEKADLVLGRMQKLCEQNFNAETLRTINRLITDVGAASQRLEAVRSAAGPQ